MIHFDMDVMDPSDILTAVTDVPEGGLKLKEVVRLTNDIAREKELVALTVEEPMTTMSALSASCYHNLGSLDV